jgi:hypothetical protein
MKYKPTPFNIFCGLLIAMSIFGAIYPGPMGFGYIGLFYLLPIAVIGLLFDFLIQLTTQSYSRIFIIELVLLALLSLVYFWPDRTKIYIIPDERNFEFIVTIYNVKDAEKLPVDLLTWTYEKEIPESGILLTSSPLDADLPETKVYTKAGVSLQDRNDTVDLCFGPAGTSTVEIDSTSYDYSAWKIDKGVTIGYSSNEIEELENILKDYLKRKGENK